MSAIVTSRWRCAKCGTQVYSGSYERMRNKTMWEYQCHDGLHFWEPIAR